MENVENLLKTTIGEIERMLSARSVVGEPITIEGNSVIPLISIGFGFGAGGGTGKNQKTPACEGFGGGTGGGGGVKPVAVIIANREGVRIEPVRKGVVTMAEKVGEVLGKIAEKREEKKG